MKQKRASDHELLRGRMAPTLRRLRAMQEGKIPLHEVLRQLFLLNGESGQALQWVTISPRGHDAGQWPAGLHVPG